MWLITYNHVGLHKLVPFRSTPPNPRHPVRLHINPISIGQKSDIAKLPNDTQDFEQYDNVHRMANQSPLIRLICTPFRRLVISALACHLPKINIGTSILFLSDTTTILSCRLGDNVICDYKCRVPACCVSPQSCVSFAPRLKSSEAGSND